MAHLGSLAEEPILPVLTDRSPIYESAKPTANSGFWNTKAKTPTWTGNVMLDAGSVEYLRTRAEEDRNAIISRYTDSLKRSNPTLAASKRLSPVVIGVVALVGVIFLASK